MTPAPISPNIAVLNPSVEVKYNVESAALNAVVDHLERCGGDLDVFADSFDSPAAYVIFALEKRLTEQSSAALKLRWDRAIRLYQTTRMKRLQRKAIDILENIDAADDKKSRVNLAFAKLVLGDLLTAANVMARNEANTKHEKSQTLDGVNDDMDGDDSDV